MKSVGKPLQVVGIMSGTSLDGVDCAWCACEPDRVRLHRHWGRSFPSGLWRRLQAAASGGADSWEVARLHHDLGRFYVQVVTEGLEGTKPDAIGLHGQTVFHAPPPARPATLQLGEPAYLAEALRVPVVANFRVGDLAAGGQGAPLATAFHQAAFGVPGQWVAVNNLGGISNVTALDDSGRARGRPLTVTAFDTGPANVLLDLAIRTWSRGRRRFDRDGRGAAAGRVDPDLLDRWMRHPYFRRRPPKSTGREEFGEAFWSGNVVTEEGGSRADLLATLAELTARSIADAYRRHLPSFRAAVSPRVVLVGGGASNSDLVGRIRRCLSEVHPGVRVGTGEEAGWPSSAVEAAAFAHLAALRLRGLPGNVPATTGARRSVWLGQIVEAP